MAGKLERRATGSQTLYHFTAATSSHLGKILREGLIRTTESNISLTREHAGPDVVWLTSNPDPEANTGWANGVRKVTARLRVEVDDAAHWPEWAAAHGCSRDCYDSLGAAGDPEEWWVRERPVRASKVVELTFKVSGEDHCFEGADLRRLFESRGRQRALHLPQTQSANVSVGGQN